MKVRIVKSNFQIDMKVRNYAYFNMSFKPFFNAKPEKYRGMKGSGFKVRRYFYHQNRLKSLI